MALPSNVYVVADAAACVACRVWKPPDGLNGFGAGETATVDCRRVSLEFCRNDEVSPAPSDELASWSVAENDLDALAGLSVALN